MRGGIYLSRNQGAPRMGSGQTGRDACMCRELAREALQGFRVRSTEDPGKIVGCGESRAMTLEDIVL